MFKKIYREFFYVPKYAKMTDKVFKGRISISVLTIIVCCALFCATTFAWFNSLQNTTVSLIVAADYSLSVKINGQTLLTDEYTCPLTTEDRHVFTITASGTATTGYCQITVDGKTYTTVPISKGTSLALTIVAAQGEEISFSAHWGACSDEGDRYGNNAVIHVSNTPYQFYAVAENVTLEQIAEYYYVSAADILLYNGISEIIVGSEIKIPNTTVTKPLVISEEPTEDMTEPAEEPTAPTEETTEPTAEVTEPTVAATEPAADSEPEPTQNETTPTEPTESITVDTDPTVPSENAETETEDNSQTE